MNNIFAIQRQSINCTAKGDSTNINCTANKEIQDGRANADILGAGNQCIHYAWIHA